MRPEWAPLSLPFSSRSRAWSMLDLSPDRRRASVAPHVPGDDLRERLDGVLGVQGWSFTLAPAGQRALVGNLTIGDVSRAAVAEAPRLAEAGTLGASPTELADRVLALCAAQFGVPSIGTPTWVEHDPDTGEVLLEEATEELQPATVAGAAVFGEDEREPTLPQLEDSSAAPSPTSVQEPRPEGHLVIDRLVDRLKSEGLGGQAARLVVRYGGYGRTPDETRELYGKLRALLVDRTGVGG